MLFSKKQTWYLFSPCCFYLIQMQGWKYVKLVGSHLDLRQVSWKKQVDVIPSRLSTDTETSSDEAPNPLPGEDRSPRPADRQHASKATWLSLRLCDPSVHQHHHSLSHSVSLLSFHRLRGTSASTAPAPVDDLGQAVSVCPLSIPLGR